MSSSESLAQTVSPHQLHTINAATVQESYPNPLVAQGHDWNKDLIHLAKTAELKRHVLSLQLHTAHILAAHASLDEKQNSLQDVKEQKNRLESERTRLLENLAQINSDREKLDLSMKTLDENCLEIKAKIDRITEGDYATAKKHVDDLREELDQPPLPSLQSIMNEKAAAYLTSRRLKGPPNGQVAVSANSSGDNPLLTPGSSSSVTVGQRNPETGEPPIKRSRGRPKGSKNKPKGTTSH